MSAKDPDVKIHRGPWTIVLPQDPRDEYRIIARDIGVAFCANRRDLVALRTALAAAILAPKKGARS